MPHGLTAQGGVRVACCGFGFQLGLLFRSKADFQQVPPVLTSVICKRTFDLA